MKYVWTVAGDDPDYGQGAKYGLDGYFFPMEDSLTTAVTVAEAAAQPGVKAIGLYMGHNWHPGYSPAQLAQVASDEVGRVTKQGMVNRGIKVMFNLEQPDPDYIAATLEAFRKLRPTTGTSWSPAAHQGGWMSDEFVARILAARVRVVPQAFIDPGMQRVESDYVLRDLLKRGFPASIISCFYDAKNLGYGWDGFAFTMGRLPWIA